MHEKVVALEIDYLELDALDLQQYAESSTEFSVSGSESIVEENVNNTDDGTISEQSDMRYTTKPDVKVMKLQTIEKIVYVHCSFFKCQVQLKLIKYLSVLLFTGATCAMKHLTVAGN